MSNYTFASMPSVSIQRSKFHRPQPHNTSFNLGELVILGFDEVIPGSTHKIDLGSLIRMSTPIAPIMDDLQFDIFSFFVPKRLTWKYWKNFMGESESAGVPATSYTIPKKARVLGSYINTIADDLGIPPYEPNGAVNQEFEISVLPIRGVYLIYNRFFRNQNVEAPYIVDTGGNGSGANVLVGGIDELYTGVHVFQGNPNTPPERLRAYKLPDYVTSALPYAQKGDPVVIPGTDGVVPVITGSKHSYNGSMLWSQTDGSETDLTAGTYYQITGGLAGTGVVGSGAGISYGVHPSNLWASRVNITNNTINDLRFAFQLQKALEKDALYGSRYWEVLRAHYAVTSPDATLQDPELLGHIKFDINISQVLQTTGFSSPSSTSLGTPGANSVTANRGHLFTASFVEHGYIYHIGVARQKRHTYSNQLNRLWSRSTRWDFYHPVFANIGAQKVKNKEVFAPRISETLGIGEQTFGFQEAWAEYRFLPGYNSGYLNPYRAGALDYWTLADDYSSTPTLSKSFLLESRDNLARALVTGSTGPDFIASFYIKDTVVDPMPLYSIPGFADHH